MVSVTKAGLLGITFTSPSEILRKLNKIVKKVNFGRVRMSLTITKITSKNLVASSAAMPPLYLFRSDTGKVEEMLVPNLPLGGLEGENYESFDAPFNKGDVLVMLSDGLAELPNKDGELLEYEKINRCILKNAKKRAAFATLSNIAIMLIRKVKPLLVDHHKPSYDWSDYRRGQI